MHDTKNSLTRRTALTFALFFALALVFQVETLLIPPRSDSAAWLFMGARQSAGQMPGRDLWDNKLPLIYLIGRCAMGSEHPQVFLWMIEAMATAVGALAIVALLSGQTNHHTGFSPMQVAKKENASGLLAGVLLCILSGAPSYHAGGYMTEIYSMPSAAVAVYLSYRAMHAKYKILTGMAAGLAWTLAVSFRLPMGLAAVTLTGYFTVFACPGRRLHTLAAHIIGAMFGLLVVMIHPMVAGYTMDSINAALLWPTGMTGAHARGPLTLSTTARLADFAQDVAKLGWLHVAAIAGLAIAYRSSRPMLAIVAGLWYVTALASAALGWASYAHYQYVAFAPCALACGLLTTHTGERRARRIAVALVGLTGLVVAGQNGKELSRNRSAEGHSKRTSVVQFIHRHTKPEETVYIWAWGRSAELLYKVDRPPGNRHFLGHAYFDMDLILFEEMVEEFLAGPPRWVVEDRDRDDPSLTGVSRSDWGRSYPDLIKLQKYVRQQYTQEAAFGNYIIWRYRN
ncbi:MAG: hypothetical protein MI923_28685 [Phycisphaerales bacterium]|nr:hypothetical protein [Phycisphaerales bacterium]